MSAMSAELLQYGPLWDRLRQTPDGCWLWAGSTLRGYGQIVIRGRKLIVHRVTYELLVCPIPKPLVLDHLCRIRNCAQPDHLDPVPQRINLLRGQGFPAEHARREACSQGHPYNQQNTYIRPGRGGRDCLICRRDRKRTGRTR